METLKNNDKLGTICLSSLCLIGSTCLIAWLVGYTSYGFDLTDESFHLVWISNPFQYKSSIAQFGFIYHFLDLLFCGNIAALRTTNILITYFLAWWLADTLLASSSKILRTKEKYYRVALSSGFATAALVLFYTWLLTPSYNSLALQGSLLVSTGLARMHPALPARRFDWILIGGGGWLAFMAKPTTALILGVVALAFFIYRGKTGFLSLIKSVTLALTLLLLSAFLIDGSISAYIGRYLTGLENAKTLGAGHDLSAMIRLTDAFLLSPRETASIIYAALTSLCVALLLVQKYRPAAWLGYAACLTATIVIVLIATRQLHVPTSPGRLRAFIVTAIPLATIGLGLAFIRKDALQRIRKFDLLLAVALLLCPVAYAAGTAAYFWGTISAAILFWLLAALVLVTPALKKDKALFLLLPLALATQVLTAMLIQVALERPYRQPRDLWTHDYSLSIRDGESTVHVTKAQGQFLDAVIEKAHDAGFTPQTPMIDLTGQSPGVLYALGAVNLGTPWILGGYPGSEDYARRILSRVHCQQLAEAWLLIEPGGPRSISPEVLATVGADLKKDYQFMAAWDVPAGLGGYKRARPQQLLKPTRSLQEATASCMAKTSRSTP